MRVLVFWDDVGQLDLLQMYLSVDDNEVVCVTERDSFTTALDSSDAYDAILMATSHPDHDAAFALFQQAQDVRGQCPIVGACMPQDVYRLAGYLTAGLRSYLIRDANADFLFLVKAIVEAAITQAETERERLISEQLRKEVESVRELQESIIPDSIETPNGFEIVARYESSQIRVIGSQPVTMAGGDYYEAFTLPDGRMVVLVGDASGHGMKACMSIFTMHTLIRMIRFDEFLDAGRLVAHINQQLCRQSVVSGKGGFITMLYGVLDPQTREFTWACAGHQMPVVHNLETDEIFEIAEPETASGLPIGIFEEGEYVTNKHIIPANTRLLLYTDGLIEAFPAGTRAGHVEFGMDGLEQTMKESKGKSAMQCLEALFDDSFAFTKGAGRHDDTSVLILESKSGSIWDDEVVKIED